MLTVDSPASATTAPSAGTHQVSVLDLFAGAGGLSAGMHAASDRFVIERAVEIDPAAAATFALNHGRDVVYAGGIEDWLREEDVPQVDVVVGGPPCQGFSLLGKRDSTDARNFLWQEYAETILRAQPKYFVLENVGAFAKSQQFADLTAAIERGGQLADYTFEWDVLNAADFGAPQARKRAIVIGRRRDQPVAPLPSPSTLAHRTVRQEFEGIPWEPDRVWDGRTVEVHGAQFAGPYTPREMHVSRTYTKLSKDRFKEIPEGGNRTNLPDDLLAPCWRGHTSGSGDVMGRLHWDRPSVTIRTEFFKPEKGRYLHPKKDRAITHYEAARLQGFPPEYQFVGTRDQIARQIGNAVPVALGRAIGEVLIERL